MQKQERSQMLGAMPMGKLVPKICTPIMVSMLVQALYNIVDSMFVARYDAMALTAVSLAMPIQMLMISVGTGLGTGINSVISRRLGEGRGEEARRAAANGWFLQVLGCLLFMVYALTLVKPTFALMTDDPTLIALGSDYLQIVCLVSIGLFMAINFERLLQSTGNSTLSMCAQLTGAITNIILDPIMIFGYCGLPAMGIKGAAIATVIGQILGSCVGFTLNQLKNSELRLSLKGFRPDGTIIRNILAVGIPSMVMSSIGSVMNVTMNMILFAYGPVAVSVLGVYFKLQSFIFMPVFGLSNGMVAIVGYNYGARNRKRVYKALKVSLTWAVTIMAIGMAAFLIFPDALLSLFEAGEASDLTRMGRVALRTICWCFLPASVCITLSTVFQAVGKGMYSLIMSLCRQLLVLLPSAWLLSTLVGSVDAVWWAFVIAEVSSLVMVLFMFRRVDRTLLRKLDEAEA